MVILLFIAGLTFLIVGAEALVRGASRLAVIMGISPLVIGLTVVAIGTSSPELAVSIQSAMSNQATIAIGNVLGSNIFNILFILGLSALIVPLIVSQKLVRFDVPLMIVLSVFVLMLSLDGNLSLTDGFLLVSSLVIYIWYSVHQSRREMKEMTKDKAKTFKNEKYFKSIWIKNIGLIFGGLTLLIIGSRWLVDSAVEFAHNLRVSELIVGLTIVAAGTSLPEVVTSIIAAIRGERDIAVGNVVGSNIFNILGVLGITSIFAPTGIEVTSSVISFDIPIMIAVAFACLPIFFTGGVISRGEGLLFLGYYIAYTLYLFLAASHHDALEGFNTVMLYFVIPVSLVTICLLVIKEIWSKKKSTSE